MLPPVTLGKVKGQGEVAAFLVDKDPEHCQCSDTRIPCHENDSHEWQPLDIDRSRHMEKRLYAGSALLPALAIDDAAGHVVAPQLVLLAPHVLSSSPRIDSPRHGAENRHCFAT